MQRPCLDNETGGAGTTQAHKIARLGKLLSEARQQNMGMSVSQLASGSSGVLMVAVMPGPQVRIGQHTGERRGRSGNKEWPDTAVTSKGEEAPGSGPKKPFMKPPLGLRTFVLPCCTTGQRTELWQETPLCLHSSHRARVDCHHQSASSSSFT